MNVSGGQHTVRERGLTFITDEPQKNEGTVREVLVRHPPVRLPVHCLHRVVPVLYQLSGGCPSAAAAIHWTPRLESFKSVDPTTQHLQVRWETRLPETQPQHSGPGETEIGLSATVSSSHLPPSLVFHPCKPTFPTGMEACS